MTPDSVPLPRASRRADPCVMAVFGASGDLTQRKLIPSLYNLALQKKNQLREKKKLEQTIKQ